MANNNKEQLSIAQVFGEKSKYGDFLKELLLSAVQQRAIGHELSDKVGHLGYSGAWNQGAALAPYSTTSSNVGSRRASSKGTLLDILYQALSGETGYAQQQVPFRDDAGSLRPGNILDIVAEVDESKKYGNQLKGVESVEDLKPNPELIKMLGLDYLLNNK
tara:strand:+ start:69 stop:551 length:483 start_codon:yes stop_codon:yes gene_type:complete